MKKDLIKEILSYVLIVVVVILIRTFIVTPIRVDGSSMYDTLKDGDIMILNKINLAFNKPSRYDIVVINYDDRIIKRVIGLPGETISCEEGIIYINGQKLGENYGFGATGDFNAVELKDDEYFVMGDNRTISKDSRIIGPINIKDIKGTTHFILFPFSRFGGVK